MSIQQMVNYWKKSASEDLITAEGLFTLGRYLPCLFYCHLFVEKIIKSIIVKETKKPAPYGHKLIRLTKYAHINFSVKQKKLLADLTAFNIKARYEDYKFSIYKKATKEYTQKYLKEAKELYLWLKEKI